MRILERLEVGYLRHGGDNNGELYVAYSQFEKDVGISRRAIRPMLQIGKELGLLTFPDEEIRTGNPRRDFIRRMIPYGLTYVSRKNSVPPADTWKSITDEQAARGVERNTGKLYGKSKNVKIPARTKTVSQ